MHVPGVQRFCYKTLSIKIPGIMNNLAIEIDGMATSESGILLVERKPRITMEYVEELDDKAKALA